jgi:hypothetical protein
MCAMTEELPQKKKTQLALALAQGATVAAWSRANEVPTRTAYRWASEPQVRATVESCRRRAVDRAVGVMARRATWAARQIAQLGKDAESESVKLAALRANFSDMIAASNFGVLEDRVAELEEQFGDRMGHTSRPA